MFANCEHVKVRVLAESSSCPRLRQFIPSGRPAWRAMLRSELPGCVLWTDNEDADRITPEGGIKLIHRPPVPFPLLAVQLAPQGRLADGLGHQLCNYHAALGVAESAFCFPCFPYAVISMVSSGTSVRVKSEKPSHAPFAPGSPQRVTRPDVAN